MKRDLSRRRTAVYKILDGEEIIYIGASVDPMNRFQSHIRLGRIQPEHKCRIISWHDVRADALKEEIDLINKLSPRLNKTGSKGFSARTLKWDKDLARTMIAEGADLLTVALACDVDTGTIRTHFYHETSANMFGQQLTVKETIR